MMQRIKATNRWCVTGTPIQHDLIGRHGDRLINEVERLLPRPTRACSLFGSRALLPNQLVQPADLAPLSPWRQRACYCPLFQPDVAEQQTGCGQGGVALPVSLSAQYLCLHSYAYQSSRRRFTGCPLGLWRLTSMAASRRPVQPRPPRCWSASHPTPSPSPISSTPLW